MLKAAIFCLVIFINPFYSCSSNRNSNSKDKSMDTTFHSLKKLNEEL